MRKSMDTTTNVSAQYPLSFEIGLKSGRVIQFNFDNEEHRAKYFTTIKEAISSRDIINMYGGNTLIKSDDISYLSKDHLILEDEVLKTSVSDQHSERKWVIPWGEDTDGGFMAVWMKCGSGFKMNDSVRISPEDWKDKPDYQFTDLEVEKLKASQASALAKAIDDVKEEVK